MLEIPGEGPKYVTTFVTSVALKDLALIQLCQRAWIIARLSFYWLQVGIGAVPAVFPGKLADTPDSNVSSIRLQFHRSQLVFP